MYVVTVQASDGGQQTTTTKEVDHCDHQRRGAWHGDAVQRCSPRWKCRSWPPWTDPDEEDGETPSPGSGTGAAAQSRAQMTVQAQLMSSYTPDDGDIGSTLRAEAKYNDGEDDDKTASEASRSGGSVSAPGNNTAPVFPDQNLNAQGALRRNQAREVPENTAAGTNIGAVVAANDAV